MKKIISFLLCAIALSGCFSEREDCLRNPIVCECELKCAQTHECLLHYLVSNEEESVTEVCVLREDVVCETDDGCPSNAVCQNGFCEESACNGVCSNRQTCHQFDDNGELICVD